MSRRNNKIATQAEIADLVSALSEAISSSSSSAPVHATRGSSAALLAKEIVQDAQPVATSSSGLGFRSFSPMASQSIPPASNSLFLAEDDLPPSNQLEVSQIVPETMLPSLPGAMILRILCCARYARSVVKRTPAFSIPRRRWYNYHPSVMNGRHIRFLHLHRLGRSPYYRSEDRLSLVIYGVNRRNTQKRSIFTISSMPLRR